MLYPKRSCPCPEDRGQAFSNWTVLVSLPVCYHDGLPLCSITFILICACSAALKQAAFSEALFMKAYENVWLSKRALLFPCEPAFGYRTMTLIGPLCSYTLPHSKLTQKVTLLNLTNCKTGILGDTPFVLIEQKRISWILLDPWMRLNIKLTKISEGKRS